MNIDEIRKLSLEYSKGNVHSPHGPRKQKRPSVETYAEWFARSLGNGRRAGPPPADSKLGKITEEGQLCRHCSIPVIRQTHKRLPKEKPGGYWFEWWFKCPQCCRLYMVEESKRMFAGGAPAPLQAAKPYIPAWHANYQYPPVEIPFPTENYRHQDAGDDGLVPW